MFARPTNWPPRSESLAADGGRVIALKRFIHPKWAAQWKPMHELAPDVEVRELITNGNGAAPGTVMCLQLIHPDGETHIYPVSEEGRRALVELLTGGVILSPGDQG